MSLNSVKRTYNEEVSSTFPQKRSKVFVAPNQLLSNDLWIYIFSFSDGDKLSSWSQVCSLFRNIINSSHINFLRLKATSMAIRGINQEPNLLERFIVRLKIIKNLGKAGNITVVAEFIKKSEDEIKEVTIKNLEEKTKLIKDFGSKINYVHESETPAPEKELMRYLKDMNHNYIFFLTQASCLNQNEWIISAPKRLELANQLIQKEIERVPLDDEIIEEEGISDKQLQELKMLASFNLTILKVENAKYLRNEEKNIDSIETSLQFFSNIFNNQDYELGDIIPILDDYASYLSELKEIDFNSLKLPVKIKKYLVPQIARNYIKKEMIEEAENIMKKETNKLGVQEFHLDLFEYYLIRDINKAKTILDNKINSSYKKSLANLKFINSPLNLASAEEKFRAIEQVLNEARNANRFIEKGLYFKIAIKCYLLKKDLGGTNLDDFFVGICNEFSTSQLESNRKATVIEWLHKKIIQLRLIDELKILDNFPDLKITETKEKLTIFCLTDGGFFTEAFAACKKLPRQLVLPMFSDVLKIFAVKANKEERLFLLDHLDDLKKMEMESFFDEIEDGKKKQIDEINQLLITNNFFNLMPRKLVIKKHEYLEFTLNIIEFLISIDLSDSEKESIFNFLVEINNNELTSQFKEKIIILLVRLKKYQLAYELCHLAESVHRKAYLLMKFSMEIKNNFDSNFLVKK